MLTNELFKPTLRCVDSNIEIDETKWVSREEFDKVKRDCELWYKMWLHECKMRK